MREQNLRNARQPANGHRRVLAAVVWCRSVILISVVYCDFTTQTILVAIKTALSNRS